MDEKTSSEMSVFARKKKKNANNPRERKRGMPKVVTQNEKEETEAVTKETKISQEQKMPQNGDTEKTPEETPKPTAYEPSTDETKETTHSTVTADKAVSKASPTQETETMSDTPNQTARTKMSKDNRKQIKLPPYLMEKIDQLKKLKKKNAYYEVLEDLVDVYVNRELTEQEKVRFDTIMSFYEEE